VSALEEDFHPCGIFMEESDIYRLVHMEDDRSDGCKGEEEFKRSDSDGDEDYCLHMFSFGERSSSSRSSSRSSSSGSSFGSSKSHKEGSQRKSKDLGDAEEQQNPLWIKYQKLKFDAHYGKDCVRRCPKCDEAQLFDEESMKLYQKRYLTTPKENNDAQNNDGAENPSSTGNSTRARLERAFNTFHLRQSGTSNATTASNQNASSNSDPSTKENSNTRKRDDAPKADDEKLSNDAATSNTEEGKNTESKEDREISNEVTNDQTPKEASSDDEVPSSSHEPNQQQKLHQNQSQSQSQSPLIKSTTPIVICHTCSTEFCYFHSNAHSSTCPHAKPISCIEYHAMTSDADRTNVEYAQRILRAKPCPTCGISVSKDGGCNQIKCTHCSTHFCWLCGAIVDDGAFPEHFRWWNLNGCANMQLDENDEPLKCTLWMARALSLAQIIVLGIPSLVLTGISWILCPCLVPGCGRTNRERLINCVSFWGSFLSSLLLLPFTCLGMLLLTTMYCFLASLAFFLKVFMPNSTAGRGATTLGGSTGGGGGSTVIGSSRDNAVDVSDRGNAATSADLIRELENIFDRMEEGRSASISH